MKIIEKRLLRGPNIYSINPVFLAILDLEDLDDVSSSSLYGFTDRLVSLIPTLSEHRCSTGYRGGFVDRLYEGTYMAHIVEHILIELQCLAGPELGFGKTRMIKGKPRHYRIICSYHVEPLVLAALPFAMKIVQSLADDKIVQNYAGRLDELKLIGEVHAVGPSTNAVLQAAKDRNIPVLRLTDTSSLYQLGWGTRAKRIRATITGNTNHIAVDIASDKGLTKQLLTAAGLPVPTGVVVTTIEEAIAYFRQVNHIDQKVAFRQKAIHPLIVKPLDSNHGKGVTVNITNEFSLASAFTHAKKWGRRIIIEEYVSGDDYRVLVVAGKVVAASRRCPPYVIGDCIHSIMDLLEKENRNPLRGTGHSSVLTRIPLDEITIETVFQQGYALDSIPLMGTKVYLRGNANLSTGGTAEDVTDLVHPLTARACEKAVLAIGLDVCGVDLVCNDIGRPLSGQRGGIIEVNAAPGIRMHEFPSVGIPRRVGAAIVDSLFQSGDNGRIPIIAVTGTNGKTTTALCIASILRQSGLHTGLTTTEGIFIDDEQIQFGDCTGYWSANMLLTSPLVDIAVLETARGGILKRGLAFDYCDVAVVLNVQPDHLGQDGIDTLEDLAYVKSLLVRQARKIAVLNIDDDLCRGMATQVAGGTEVIFFSADDQNPDIRRHLMSGGRAVVLRGSDILLCEGSLITPLVNAKFLAFTLHGAAHHNVLNALASTAAAWGMGLSRKMICEGLTSFKCTSIQNPLRLNIFKVNGITVLVDYAHNPTAYRALAATGRRLTKGKVVALVSAPGDRRDQELAAIGHECAAIDHVIVYEMDDKRGRVPGQTTEIIAAAANSGLNAGCVEIIPDLREAIRTGIARCSPDDILLYGCASYLADLQSAIPDGFEEFIVEERRSAHLAQYADGHSMDIQAHTLQGGWDPSCPDRRLASVLHIVAALERSQPVIPVVRE